MKPPNPIKTAFTSSMRKCGFNKKSDCWYRQTTDAILVTNLHKSNYGDQYYVNLAVWLKAFGESAFPKDYQCHVRLRASMIEADKQRFWEAEVFNLDHPINEVMRGDVITAFLESVAIPFLLNCGSVENLRRLLTEGQLRHAAIVVAARKMIEG